MAVSSYNNYYTGTVVIPKSININGNTYPVTSIDSYAFYGCNGLTSVTIPISVISIGNFAFYGCSSLTTIVSEIDNPFSVDNSIFNGIDSNVLLIVPKGKKTIYQSTAGWSQFMNIVEYEKRKTIHVATAGTLPDLILNYEENLIVGSPGICSERRESESAVQIFLAEPPTASCGARRESVGYVDT